jgi:hypothetical protein
MKVSRPHWPPCRRHCRGCPAIKSRSSRSTWSAWMPCATCWSIHDATHGNRCHRGCPTEHRASLVRPGRRHCRRWPWPGHADGQGRRRQDHAGRGHRRGAGPARPARAPDHLRPGRAPGRYVGRRAGQSDAQPHRPAGRNRALPRTCDGNQGRRSSMPKAAPCWKKTCARPVPRKSRCSRRSPAPSAKPARKFVVMDTAPTGHTLLLLDATGAYHRDIVPGRWADRRALHHADDAAAGPQADQGADRHPGRNHPGAGSRQPAGDLRRAGIEPWAWVINNSVAAA